MWRFVRDMQQHGRESCLVVCHGSCFIVESVDKLLQEQELACCRYYR